MQVTADLTPETSSRVGVQFKQVHAPIHELMVSC